MAGALEVFKKTNDETTDALRRQQEERARRVAAIRGMAEEVGTLKNRRSEVVRASSERIAKACPRRPGQDGQPITSARRSFDQRIGGRRAIRSHY